ncbi:MAG: hypothetical protein KI790_13110 [Cyclobacteriaceae bacterium]|nr:hypothetical protein [Cyclobacteriaceae bacterium HetDA_MAG_MS6]
MNLRLLYIVLLSPIASEIYGQPNCNAFLYTGDTLKYEACKISEGVKGHYQFSKAFQEILDDALLKDPSYDYAYREKSVAYLKSGDFLTWKKLMDQAVEVNPIENLGYRGWCRYQFFRDYKGAIEDIERLGALINGDIGTSANGDYHLEIARAICYKALGKKLKAIEIIETQFSEEDYFFGKYDYLHLGILYLEIGEYEKALGSLRIQEKENDLAENHFYLALVHKDLGNQSEYIDHLVKARELYVEGRMMSDPYTHPYDKVYLADIETELKTAYNK